MIGAIVVLSIVSVVSIVTALVAIISAYKANKSNSEIAKQFVNMVFENGDKIDLYEDGKHTATAIQFPNSEGF